MKVGHGMRLTYRELTVEVADEDPRTLRVLALLFGEAVVPHPDPPLQPEPPSPAPGTPSPPSLLEPPITVPPAVLMFWSRLTPRARAELLLLAKRNWHPAELERALKIPRGKLMGQHSVVARFARRFKVNPVILMMGRGRGARRFWLRSDLVPFVKALAATPDAAVT